MFSLFKGYSQLAREASEAEMRETVVQTLRYNMKPNMALVGLRVQENIRLGFKSPDFFTCQNSRNKLLSIMQQQYGDECLLAGYNRYADNIHNYLFAVPEGSLSSVIVNESTRGVVLVELNNTYDRLLDMGTMQGRQCLKSVVVNYLRNECFTCSWLDGRLFEPRGFSKIEVVLFKNLEETANFDNNMKRAETMDKVNKKKTVLFCYLFINYT